MGSQGRTRSARFHEEAGVALPVSLLCLVAVSVLVTGALVTASVELDSSRAQQEAARSLYAANAALEEFVAARALRVEQPDQRLVNGETSFTLATGEQYTMVVSELFRGSPAELPDGGLHRRDTYAVVAQPASGRGRTVGALVEAARTAEAVPPDAGTGGDADEGAADGADGDTDGDAGAGADAGADGDVDDSADDGAEPPMTPDLDASPQVIDRPTFGWFEVIR
jgi:hypothetical protein